MTLCVLGSHAADQSVVNTRNRFGVWELVPATVLLHGLSLVGVHLSLLEVSLCCGPREGKSTKTKIATVSWEIFRTPIDNREERPNS